MASIVPVTVNASRLAGVSEELRRFVEQYPYERRSILAFIAQAAASLPAGARVVDVGAGDAPYRELFAHADYVTVEWSESPHDGAVTADVQASAERMPFDDASADAAILTQVLEHVPQPADVVAEVFRILRPGGAVFVTAPLAWELHELPHDYFRYTEPALRMLLAGAGFEAIDVQARNDCFTTLAQLTRNVVWAMGRAPDGLDATRSEVAGMLEELSDALAELAPLDTRHIFPLGYEATALRPVA